MTRKLCAIVTVIVAGALTGLALLAWSSHTSYAAGKGPLLTGSIKADSGERLAGVTVSARSEGSNITASVFTDEQGNYYFSPLDDGNYQVSAQAVGSNK